MSIVPMYFQILRNQMFTEDVGRIVTPTGNDERLGTRYGYVSKRSPHGEGTGVVYQEEDLGIPCVIDVLHALFSSHHLEPFFVPQHPELSHIRHHLCMSGVISNWLGNAGSGSIVPITHAELNRRHEDIMRAEKWKWLSWPIACHRERKKIRRILLAYPRFYFAWQQYPFGEGRFFSIAAPDQYQADTKATALIRQYVRLGQSVQHQFYSMNSPPKDPGKPCPLYC
jgi:hypothetical protein